MVLFCRRSRTISPWGRSGLRRLKGRPGVWLPLLGLALLSAGPSLGAEVTEAPATLPDLMRAFAQSGAVRASFQESRMLTVLVDPIETTGQLYFLPPKRLARVTRWPTPSRVIVDDRVVVLEDGLGRRELNLKKSPVGQSLIGGIVLLLGGDLEGLNRLYETAYEAHGEAWTLTMLPINANLRSMIREIRAEGRGRDITRLTTVETNGDITTTQLTDIETDVSVVEVERAAFPSTRVPRK